MPFAGPVFQEWYWGPVFLAMYYGPPLLLSAVNALVVDAVGNWLARRRGRRRAAVLRATAGACAVVGGFALALRSGVSRGAFFFAIYYWPYLVLVAVVVDAVVNWLAHRRGRRRSAALRAVTAAAFMVLVAGFAGAMRVGV